MSKLDIPEVLGKDVRLCPHRVDHRPIWPGKPKSTSFSSQVWLCSLENLGVSLCIFPKGWWVGNGNSRISTAVIARGTRLKVSYKCSQFNDCENLCICPLKVEYKEKQGVSMRRCSNAILSLLCPTLVMQNVSGMTRPDLYWTWVLRGYFSGDFMTGIFPSWKNPPSNMFVGLGTRWNGSPLVH